jgi:hypothetical protein
MLGTTRRFDLSELCEADLFSVPTSRVSVSAVFWTDTTTDDDERFDANWAPGRNDHRCRTAPTN